jgi:hypothetical protein
MTLDRPVQHGWCHLASTLIKFPCTRCENGKTKLGCDFKVASYGPARRISGRVESLTVRVLNRRRELTLNMIRRLHAGLGIPAESLIKVGPKAA